MAKELTDEQVEMEISRLLASEEVQLAKQEVRIKYKRRQYLYQLRWMEKRGKKLIEDGITSENMEEMLLTVPEVAEILKTNTDYVYKLQKAGIIRFMKIGRLKCRKSTLEQFLEKYDGCDISDPFNIQALQEGEE